MKLKLKENHMKTTKRLISALLAALLTLTLVACNKNDKNVNIPASKRERRFSEKYAPVHNI